MEISIHGHNMTVSTRLQNYVEKKTARLDRYMPDIQSVRVDLTSQKARNVIERKVAQLTIRDGRGTILRAEEHNNDMFAAVDAVIDKLYKQIRRYRGKQRRRWRKGSSTSEMEMVLGEPLPIDEALDSDEGTVVRTKSFPLRPMSAEEGIDQMELLGHDFYVFFNDAEEAVNVLYKRRDGNYGLLQPEMA